MRVQHKQIKRRLRVSEMDRIDARDVRPLVQMKDDIAYLQRNGELLRINLLWQERWGGTFGPQSSSIATRLRRNADFSQKLVSLTLANANQDDRGQRPAWVMYFACPTCERRCRVLYSLKGRNEYGCGKCNRPAWESNTWPHTGRRNACGVSALERARLKHEQAARRLKVKLMGQPAAVGLAEHDKTAQAPLRKPARMSRYCFDDLSHQIRVHEGLAMIAQIKSAQHTLARLSKLRES
jgi:hypothetical protein